MTKTPTKFQNVWYTMVRGVAPTSYQCHRVTTKKKHYVEKKQKVEKRMAG